MYDAVIPQLFIIWPMPQIMISADSAAGYCFKTTGDNNHTDYILSQIQENRTKNCKICHYQAVICISG